MNTETYQNTNMTQAQLKTVTHQDSITFFPGMFGNILALISGAVLTLAFAPFELFPLAILSPAFLLILWLGVSPRRAFLRGWLYGLGFFATGVYWVFTSVHTYGEAAAPLAGFITGALIAILALYPALSGYLLNRYFPRLNNTKILCAFPAIWVLLEWVRSWLFTGFPWLTLGYSQTNSSLKGYAAIFSMFGVSLAVLIISGLLVNMLIKMKNKQYITVFSNLFVIIAIWLVGMALSFIDWTQPKGDPIQVSLVQGNIPQSIKWSPEQVQPTLDRYTELTQSHWDSKIIIWPESAIPTILQNAVEFLENMSAQAKQHHATFITGIPMKVPNAEGFYNAVIALGEGKGIYFKHRLVPFGEYTPMRSLLTGILGSFNIPMSDFIAAPASDEPLFANDIKIATFICYEIAFPEQVLNHNTDIGIILTVSNDGWFGHSIAQAQHLQMAKMRALEMGRPVLFVSNDGMTAFITDKGKVKSEAPQYQAYVLTDSVQAYARKNALATICHGSYFGDFIRIDSCRKATSKTVIKSSMNRYLIFIIFIALFITACGSHEERVTLFPLNHYNQKIENWINPNDPDYDRPLLNAELQQKRFDIFLKHYIGTSSPWSADYVKKNLQQPYPDEIKTTEKNLLALYSNRKKSLRNLGVAENFRPYSLAWINAIEKNVNLSQFEKMHYAANQRAIAIDNLAVRALPSNDVYFYSHTIAGQGYPFDHLQMSALWAGTPVYILGETRDHAWKLVLTPEYIGWVKSTGIARVNDQFINNFQAAARKQLIAIAHTQTSIIDSHNQFRFSAYVGSVFPGEKMADDFKILVPIADAQHNATIVNATVSADDAVSMPIPATLHNFSRIMSTLLGRPYGWGNLYFYNDCSAELKSFFTPFGIWLPRSSIEQAYAGKVVNLNAASPQKRLDYLMQNGHRFFTIVYIGGHVLLYIGNYPNPNDPKGASMAMTYQNKWGLSPKPPVRRAIIGKSILFPMLLQYPEDKSLASLAAKNVFRMTFLDVD